MGNCPAFLFEKKITTFAGDIFFTDECTMNLDMKDSIIYSSIILIE